VHLTGLKIAGFKSFVDPVDVPIEKGLTGVVGPNGCGKSNLLEALRWAMGASSARAMRGGEMDDLIFSGTTERPARESAEVELILDNSARTAPAEFNEEDRLEISRTIRRGVGSTYRINGRTVRAKDIQILFADASTGANSPALVRQGQISELIASKPQNRRRILEEAAGIGGLAARRHEAELKLRAAEENLDRLAEIMAEVERQAASLKRQSGKARRYRELSDQIAALEARLAAARWRSAVIETLDARRTLEEAKAEEARTVLAVTAATTAELEARAAIDPLRATETDAAGRLGALKIRQSRLGAERDHARDAVRRLESDLKRLEAELARETAQRDDARARADRAAHELSLVPPEDLEAVAATSSELAAALTAARDDLAAADRDLTGKRDALSRADALAAAGRQQLEREKSRLARLDAEIERTRAAIAGLGDEARLQDARQAALAKREAAQKRAEDLQAQLAAINKAVDEARSTEARATPAVHAAERRVGQLEAEIAGLDRLLRRSTDTFGPPVLDSIEARGLERAIAAALDTDLEAPISPEAPAHWSDRHGRTGGPLPGGAPPLADLVRAPNVLRARLSQCGLVPRADGDRLQSQLATGQRLVSVEGDVWRWDGFVRRSDAPLPAAERLAQKTRRDQCAAELGPARDALQAALTARNAASKALTDAETQQMAARRSLPEAMRAASDAREAALRAEQDIERLALKAASLKDSLARLASEHEQAAASVTSAESSLASGPTEADKAAVSDLAARVSQLREAQHQAASAVEHHRRETERAAALRSALTRDRDEWAARAATADAHIAKLDTSIADTRAIYEDAKGQPEALQAQLDVLAGEAETAEAERRAAADALAEADAALRHAETALRAARDGASSAREALVRADARLENAVRREVEIAETVRAQFNRELEALETLVAAAAPPESEDDAPSDAAAMDARLAKLRRERDQLGAVNMEADDQLAEITGRMGIQVEERDDLVAAIAKLREGVNALNQEGRSRLLEAFESVHTHFRSLFTALFGGGEAELRLTESEDPLDAGLEIFASPPGKRLGTLALMSGGEQALTAAALIFAVFLSRPAPICVLDEVDAPLDDANVDRFCRLLDEMRRRTDTRFIVITHNAVTMSRMDRLFGVTMQERGVSRLVSVDLEAAERLVAA
jgi:chromosome segregation protein